MDINPFIIVLVYIIGYSPVIGIVLVLAGMVSLMQQRRQPAQTTRDTHRRKVAIGLMVLGSLLFLYLPWQTYSGHRRFVAQQNQQADNIHFTVYEFSDLPPLLTGQDPLMHLDQYAKQINPVTGDTAFMNGPKYTYLVQSYITADDGHASVYQFSTAAYDVKPGACAPYDLEFPDSMTKECNVIGQNAAGDDIYLVHRASATAYEKNAYVTDLEGTRISLTGVGGPYEQSFTDDAVIKLFRSARKIAVSRLKFSE